MRTIAVILLAASISLGTSSIFGSIRVAFSTKLRAAPVTSAWLHPVALTTRGGASKKQSKSDVKLKDQEKDDRTPTISAAEQLYLPGLLSTKIVKSTKVSVYQHGECSVLLLLKLHEDLISHSLAVANNSPL